MTIIKLWSVEKLNVTSIILKTLVPTYIFILFYFVFFFSFQCVYHSTSKSKMKTMNFYLLLSRILYLCTYIIHIHKFIGALDTHRLLIDFSYSFSLESNYFQLSGTRTKSYVYLCDFQKV